ncbi:hypothetical protein [Gardnerella vaginalis]|uniref:hypothetical protein n=1 Tax=Gardnerella vaginalis TaxID=2702 RepID=UPI0039EE6F54
MNTMKLLVMQGISSTCVEQYAKSIREEIFMEQTYEELVSSIVEDYLEHVDADNPPSPATIKREMLWTINDEVNECNKGSEDPPGSGEFPYPKKGKTRYDIPRRYHLLRLGASSSPSIACAAWRSSMQATRTTALLACM